EKIGVSHCARCGRALSVPRLTPSKLHKLPASQRRLERMYGGQLCHNCLRDLLKKATRGV
ncbi:MAG: 50S ribosomal protein L34e, partial [Candidatus Bathyarchaeia archaeon]